MTKKVLITGASGLLGRSLVKEFSDNSWEVLGLAFSRAKGNLVKVDLNDEEAVRRTVGEFKPDVIIHSAAQRSPDKVESEFEESRKLNVLCSHNLAKIAGDADSAFIYISTDYVFDGKNPPYKETDEPNPLNQYGITKADGEKEVMKANAGSCILRIPVLYGDEEYLGESAISSLIKCLNSETPSKVSDYELRFPSHTDDIASICVQLSEKKLLDPTISSVYHWCGSEPFTKYTMIKVIAEVFSLSYSHLTPDNNPSTGALRPKNTQLSHERLDSLSIGHHTTFRVGVRKSFAKFFDKTEDALN